MAQLQPTSHTVPRAPRISESRQTARGAFVLLAATWLAACCLLAISPAWASVPTKKVLVLFPYENNYPGFFYFDRALRSTLQASGAYQFDFYVECMDLLRFPRERYFEELIQLYREKYGDKRFDLIIATLSPSMDFLARHRDELFPGTPVLFVEIDTRLAANGPLREHTAVVTGRFDFEGTLELALGLHPNVRDVFVISGASQGDRGLELLVRESFGGFAGRIRLHYLCGLPTRDLLERVATLPGDSLVFFLTCFQDGDGKAFLPSQMLSLIAEKANVPIYAIFEAAIGSGAVGGRMYSFARLGERTAVSAQRLLSGEATSQLEPVELRADTAIFDWHQLQRWGIGESSLPPERIIRNREVSVWESYRLQILGIAALLILQAVLISLLVFNLGRRRQANRALSQSEAKLQRAAEEWQTTFDTFPDLIMVLDPDFRILRVNRAAHSFFNLPSERTPGRSCHSPTDGLKEPFDRQCLERCVETKSLLEREIHDQKGDTWYLVSAAPILGGEGTIAGFLYAARDITERRRAEAEARRRMTELAHVTRVATMGELATSLAHEINQPLTAILSNAQAAQRFLTGSGPDIEEVRQILDDIVRDDKRVSEVIRRMRALLRKQSGSSERFLLGEAILECVAMVKSAAPLEGLSITVELGRDPVLVCADRVQLQQVLFNLMVNAAASMKNASPTSRNMAVSMTRENVETVKVSVSDSGSGIDEHNVGRLFEPFYTTKPDGMGMGLSISQTIIKAHGGTMGALNNPLGGATFYFTLPASGEGLSC